MVPSPKLRLFLLKLLRFICVGLAGTSLNVLVTIGLSHYLPLPAASAIAFVIAGQVSFQLHARWTFGLQDVQLLWRWLLFTSGSVVFAFLNRAVLAMSLQLFDCFETEVYTKIAAFLVAYATTWPCNLAWCNLVVFCHARDDRRDESA